MGRRYESDTANHSHLITAGYDNLIRVFKTSESERDSEARTLDGPSESVLGLDTSDKYVAVGSEDSSVSLYSYPEFDFIGLVTRATLPVRSVAFSPNGERIAVASDETTVKVVETEDIEKTILLKGHTKSIKNVSWHPNGSLLTTSGCEGIIRVWDISSDPECIRTIDGIIPSSDPEADTNVPVVWHPSGAYFAAAGRTNDIAIVTKDGWVKTRAIAAESPVLQLAWSPNGIYLAASTVNGLLAVFDVAKKERIAEQKGDSKVSGISWHPTGNTLAYVNLNGQLMSWDDVIPIAEGVPGPADRINRKDEVAEKPVSKSNAVSREPSVQPSADGDAEMDDWIIDDDGAGYVPTGTAKKDTAPTVQTLAKATITMQEPFQPGSTPAKGNRRYLAFNMSGTISTVDQETHNVVTVEFHDKSTHRGYHFTDHFQYSMASLGDRGALFAAKSSGDSPSVIYYKPFQSWTTASEWQFNLPQGEEVQAVTVGSRGAIVATSEDYIRFFSHSGVQTYIYCMNGVIALAAKNDFVMILHHLSVGASGHQDIGYSVLNVEDYTIVQSGKLPLRQGMTVTWIGCSEEGAPLFYDSKGVLFLLDRYRRASQARWIPVFSSAAAAKKEVNLHYWPIGANSTHFLCCILKGINETYPHGPKPIIQEAQFQLPLLSTDAETGQLEEVFLRETMFAQLREDQYAASDELEDRKEEIAKERISIDKHLLKLIQLACKGEKMARALDLTAQLKNAPSVDAACRIAGFFHLPALQERMNLIKEAKFLEQGEMDEFSSIRQRLSRDIISTQGSTLLRDFNPSSSLRESSVRDYSMRDTSLLRETSAMREVRESSRETSIVPATQEEPEEISMPPPPKSTKSSNPWLSKKPKANNPFIKGPNASSSNISRSNSFFDRVDAGTKQVTLFGTAADVSTSKRRRDDEDGENKRQKSEKAKGKERATSPESQELEPLSDVGNTFRTEPEALEGY